MQTSIDLRAPRGACGLLACPWPTGAAACPWAASAVSGCPGSGRGSLRWWPPPPEGRSSPRWSGAACAAPAPPSVDIISERFRRTSAAASSIPGAGSELCADPLPATLSLGANAVGGAAVGGDSARTVEALPDPPLLPRSPADEGWAHRCQAEGLVGFELSGSLSAGSSGGPVLPDELGRPLGGPPAAAAARRRSMPLSKPRPAARACSA
mmetsp:Transcript_11851/g.28124  ORF Transcript_11851/g.28124 Transcript_11851/m.28124 type:complete len:210 (-) Transcript_11851:2541-3170(-)